LVLGLAGSFALTRLIKSALWGVTATDPATYAAISLGLIAVALFACLVPTRRAVQVDPTVALRYE
jgi:putative ABC transport system permease protein